jgi:hypothetical protein
MAKDTIFKQLRDEAKGRELSVQWYRSKIRALAPRISANRMIKQGKTTLTPNYGLMNLFWYKPLHASKLSYYDIFPLVIPFKYHRNGFTGINFHYLSVPMRVALLERLQGFEEEAELYRLDEFGNEREKEVLAFQWSEIIGMRGLKKTIHRYLAKYVYSNFLKIGLDDMIVASLLPVERFYTGDLWSDMQQRVQPREVWTDSRRAENYG